jgi:tetratricopeptide (TPR) repeat protein
MKHSSRLAFLVFFAITAVRPSFAQDSFEAGKAAYKAGDFHKAATCLRQAVAENESDPNRRYYLANSLANTGELGAAKQQYEMCVRLSPSSAAAQLSKAALSTAPHPYKTRCLDYTAGDGTNKALPLANVPGSVAPGTASGSQDGRHVRQFVNQIRNQVNDYKMVSEERSQMYQPSQFSRHHSRHRDMQFLSSLSGSRRGWNGSNWAVESERQNQIEDTARSLEEMMLNNNGSVRLNPLGTNLYVRNYGSAPSTRSIPAEPQPIIELLAKQEKLVVDGTASEHHAKAPGP